MTIATITPRVRWVPAITGAALWVAGTALLLEDQFRSGHWDVAHLAVPILTGATCVAGVLSHHAFARWQLISGVALALLALLGSGLCLLNTLGRTAADRDAKLGAAMKTNRTLDSKLSDLKDAKASAKTECRTIGPKCTQWLARVDLLTNETAGMSTAALDPKADAIVRLAVLVGFDGERTRATVTAIEPAALPIFLEFGAIVLLSVAFPHRKRATVHTSTTVSDKLPGLASEIRKSFSQGEALSDFRSLKTTGSQKFLSERWQVSEGCVSKWLSAWERGGAIERRRNGKALLAIAVPRPRRLIDRSSAIG